MWFIRYGSTLVMAHQPKNESFYSICSVTETNLINSKYLRQMWAAACACVFVATYIITYTIFTLYGIQSFDL